MICMGIMFFSRSSVKHHAARKFEDTAFTTQHITAKEGSALVLAARHLTRSASNRGKRHLIFVDSFSLSMAICKGRACSFQLLRTTQQIAALSLAGAFLVLTRWLPSELNVAADGSSQRQIKPGPFEAFHAESRDPEAKTEGYPQGTV